MNLFKGPDECAGGLDGPGLMTIDATGTIYASNEEAGSSGNDIIKITPLGAESVYATGLNNPHGLAFDSTGDLFVADFSGGSLTEILTNGTESPFASSLDDPAGLAFSVAPEPSVFGWVAGGGAVVTWGAKRLRRGGNTLTELQNCSEIYRRAKRIIGSMACWMKKRLRVADGAIDWRRR